MEEMQKFAANVGYWVTEKRFEKINFKGFQELCRKEGIQVTEIKLKEDLDSQGTFQVVLHRGSDLIAHEEGGDEEASTLLNRFNLYLDKHPETVLLDPINDVRKISHRLEMCRLFKSKVASENVHVPSFICIDEPGDVEKVKQEIQESPLSYPIIAKPVLAHDHNLMLVFNCEGLVELTKLRPPILLQQYIPHNGTLHKINVIGKNISVIHRPSLRNMTTENRLEKSISFHTHSISKPGCKTELNSSQEETTDSTPDLRTVYEIATKISAQTNLTLFGVDLIVESGTGKHYIIDINYFPGFEGTERVPEKLLELTKEHVMKSMERRKAQSSKSQECQHNATPENPSQ